MKQHSSIQSIQPTPRARTRPPGSTAIALLLALLLLAIAAPPAWSQERQPEGSIRVGVNGVVCAFCVQGIERHFRAREEVGRMFISLSHSVLLLELKPEQQMGDDEIIKTIKNAGYEAVRIERLEVPFDEERKRLREKK